MQEIKLEFKQLTDLPVPTSQNEILCCKENDGSIYCFQARNVGAGKFVFICDLELNWTYAHVKVTASETPQFKVGDKVNWKGYNSQIVATAKENDNLFIQYLTPKFEMGFIGYKTNTVLALPKELTLITNE